MVCFYATKQKTMCACVETKTEVLIVVLMKWEYRNSRTRRGPICGFQVILGDLQVISGGFR